MSAPYTTKPVRNADGSVSADFYNEDYWEHGDESGRGSYNGNEYSDQLDLCKFWAQDTYDKYGPFDSYLELGCGRGWAIWGFDHLTDLQVVARGVDISHYAIETSKVKDQITEHDIADLSFIDDLSVDFVFSNDVMEHLTVDQIKSCLAHCGRIAKKRIVHLISVGDGTDHNGIVPTDGDQSHISLMSHSWWINTIFDPLFSADEWILESTPRDRTVDFVVTRREAAK